MRKKFHNALTPRLGRVPREPGVPKGTLKDDINDSNETENNESDTVLKLNVRDDPRVRH